MLIARAESLEVAPIIVMATCSLMSVGVGIISDRKASMVKKHTEGSRVKEPCPPRVAQGKAGVRVGAGDDLLHSLSKNEAEQAYVSDNGTDRLGQSTHAKICKNNWLTLIVCGRKYCGRR